MEEIISAADFAWVIETRGDTGNRPTGIVLARGMGGGRAIEPHIDWFPWATGRNKLEGMAAYVREIGKSFKIMAFVAEPEAQLFDRLADLRMMRRGCKVIDYTARGEHARFFYTVGP